MILKEIDCEIISYNNLLDQSRTVVAEQRLKPVLSIFETHAARPWSMTTFDSFWVVDVDIYGIRHIFITVFKSID